MANEKCFDEIFHCQLVLIVWLNHAETENKILVFIIILSHFILSFLGREVKAAACSLLKKILKWVRFFKNNPSGTVNQPPNSFVDKCGHLLASLYKFKDGCRLQRMLNFSVDSLTSVSVSGNGAIDCKRCLLRKKCWAGKNVESRSIDGSWASNVWMEFLPIDFRIFMYATEMSFWFLLIY